MAITTPTVVPRMIIRNMNVSTTSVVRHAASRFGFPLRTTWPCPASPPRPGLWFVEVVVLGILRPLQGRLEGQPLLGDLIHPHTRRN